MTLLRIGVAQLELGELAGDANIESTVDSIDEMAAAGGKIVVLPELANTGYVLDRDRLFPHAEEYDLPGPALRAWSQRAAHHRITVVAGFAERSGDRLYNSAVVFGPDGSVAAKYRKLHLFAGETHVFDPGDSGLPVVEIDGVELGVLICYDLRFPEAVRILAAKGADVVAVPTAWVQGFDRPAPSDGDIGQVRTARVMANLNSTVLACASQVGQSPDHTFLGSSLIIDPFGNDILGPAARDVARVLVTDVDLSIVANARNRGDGMSPLKQRRTDVYDALLGYRDPAVAPPSAAFG